MQSSLESLVNLNKAADLIAEGGDHLREAKRLVTSARKDLVGEEQIELASALMAVLPEEAATVGSVARHAAGLAHDYGESL